MIGKAVYLAPPFTQHLKEFRYKDNFTRLLSSDRNLRFEFVLVVHYLSHGWQKSTFNILTFFYKLKEVLEQLPAD